MLKEELAATEKTNALLERDVAYLSSPLRIATIAETELGMTPQTAEDRFYLCETLPQKKAETSHRKGLWGTIDRLLSENPGS